MAFDENLTARIRKPPGIEVDGQLKEWIWRAVKFVGKLPAK